MQNNQDSQTQRKPRKAVYLLPNLFTTAGLFAGFYAIILAINGRFTAAAIAVIIAMFLDGIDGRVARMTNTQSEFGAQYDSLADLLSFGLAPALIMYEWSLASMVDLGWQWARFGWLAAFFYTAMAAMRLARFNIQTGVIDKRYFLGLASPSAATLMVSFVWVFDDMGLKGNDNMLWLPSFVLTILAAILMVLPVLYTSFKGVGGSERDRIPFLGISVVVLMFVLVAIDPPKVFFIVFVGYALSGPVQWLVRRIRQKRRREQPQATSPTGGGMDSSDQE
ncbi:MAG TPA: phosphatidylcholine/phosphatidylserine synthase [Gammaproteobacteria bacterium]|nr:phosphatidylcholine/phosphatidylserine synthase [Gammaproteobacteria bacterium]